MLASYLMAAPDFAVTGAEPLPEMEPFGLPEPARAAAVEWQRHVVEVETGLPPGAATPGAWPPRLAWTTRTKPTSRGSWTRC